MAKEIGFEKLVLKQQSLIGTFVSDEKSAYYESDKFTKVLDFIKQNPKTGEMSEKNGRLRMKFTNVNSVNQALSKLVLLK
jgi:transcription-repair coupling factor (superfamily II helicase)